MFMNYTRIINYKIKFLGSHFNCHNFNVVFF